MSIEPQEIQASYDVLRENGNMSSPTILFVIKAMLEQKNIKPKDTIFAAAFGPGLSIETVLLEA